VAGFLPPVQSSLETTFQLATTHVLQARTIELPLGTVLGSTYIHLTCLARLVQPVGGRYTTRGPINQEVGTPPPPGFPQTMLNVKRVKDNMGLAFIEKLFTNREIGTSCKQDTCALRVCRMKAKNICVTSIVSSCGKL